MRQDRPLHERIVMILSFTMGVVYILVGVGIMVVPVDFLGLSSPIKIAFGSLLIVYGIFRTFRAYKQSAQ